MRRLGHLLARRPWGFIATWLIAVLASFAVTLGGVTGEGLFDRLTGGEPTVPSESLDGSELLAATAPTGTSIQLLLDHVDPASADLERVVTATRQQLLAVPGVVSALDPYVAASATFDPRAFVATDGGAILVTASLERDLPSSAEEAPTDEVFALLGGVSAQVPGSSGLVGSVPYLIETITNQAEQDLRTGEVIALPLSLLVMVVVFGGFLAAGLPIFGAVASIAGALISIFALTYVMPFDASVVSVVTVLGLGLCIDYGLLLVSRYREELRALHAAHDEAPSREALADALARTMATAGRTVLFSGITVAISLTGLLVFHAELLRGVGAAGISIVLVAVLVAMTLVPALIAAAGDRLIRPGRVTRIPGVRRLGDVAPDEGAFSRLARGVQRRPWLVALGTVAVLVLLALPSLSIRLVNSGVGLLPPEAPQRQLFDGIETRFPATAVPPVIVIARATPAELGDLPAQVAGLPGVTSVDPVEQRTDPAGSSAGTPVSVFGVRVEGGESSDTAREVVNEIRAVTAPIADDGTEIYVTGQSAQLVDFVDDIIAQAPKAIAIVVVATFVLLFLLTGSVLVPAKALLMNVVSLGASFGVLVWVFQEGHLEDLLGFSSTGGIETLIPPLVLAFGFGLAMDYEVFLISRIKELRDHGLSNDEAVVSGLQRSGRIITSAALIVVIVFAGFVAGQLLVIKQTGVALAVAVAIDATLVRMLLVPATMTLLGEWNWWAPAPLRRLHARFGVSEH